MSGITARPYQEEAIAAVMAALARGVTRPLVSLPTGTGKTIVFAELLRRRAARGLILAHRDELIQQAADKVRMVWPDAGLGIVKAEMNEVHARTIVASVQTLARPRRLDMLTDELERGLFAGEDIATIVVDEAHHATADTYVRVLSRLGSFGRRNGGGSPLTLGVTATAMRADGTPLGDVWQEIVYAKDILPMIQAGYLCDLRAIAVHIEVDLDQVHVQHGDLKAGELDKALREAAAPAHAAEAYQKYAQGRTALVFTPSVEMAYEMADAFVQEGVAAEALDGETPLEERRAILRRFKAGETKVLANCAVLTEGFDEPRIDCIIVARPTKSRPLYVQMVGRGTRTFPGKTDCLVIDMVGNTRRHSLASMATLLGSEAAEVRMKEGESVLEAIARAEQEGLSLEVRGKLVAQAVDLFSSREMQWVMAAPNAYLMDVGDGAVIAIRSDDLERWSVDYITRDRTVTPLAAGLDLGYAQGTGEDFARTTPATLVRRDAPWRGLPASPKQIDALRRWKVDLTRHPGLTRGKASDLLTAASGRARLGL